MSDYETVKAALDIDPGQSGAARQGGEMRYNMRFKRERRTPVDPPKPCHLCGQPLRPKGVRKRPGEYDHAAGCPYARKK